MRTAFSLTERGKSRLENSWVALYHTHLHYGKLATPYEAVDTRYTKRINILPIAFQVNSCLFPKIRLVKIMAREPTEGETPQ